MATTPPAEASPNASTRPYLIRALHEWCTDHGYTPYLAVYVTPAVQVPPEYVKNHEIVLNVGFEATSGLELGNEYISFKARFGGVPRDILVPVDHVVAIYARENGQGMAFPMPAAGEASSNEGLTDVTGGGAQPPRPPSAATPRKHNGPGLRLAASSDEGGETSATPLDAAAGAGGTPDEPPTEPPSGGGGPRPALKRVK